MHENRGTRPDDPDDGFTRALAAEVERRMDIPPSFDPQEAFAKVQARIGASRTFDRRSRAGIGWPRRENGVSTGSRRGTAPLRKIPRLWAAKVGVLAVCLVFGIVALFARRMPTPVQGTAHVYRTGADQEATVRLADGTRVLLSPRTAMRVMPFDARSRIVVFEGGEAYFSVAPSPGAPFLVRKGTAVARVLGTDFLVRSSADERAMRVAVASGRVRLQTLARVDRGVTLGAGQRGDVTDSTVRTASIASGDSTTGLERGLLVFRKVPASAVLKTLSQWYGYQFRFADATIPDRIVTIMITTQSSARALAEVKRVLAVNLMVVGDTITLMNEPPRPVHGTSRKQSYDTWTPNREVGR